MGDSLKGQVAIVTGASGALGTSVVISLLAAGATVAGIDRVGAKAESGDQAIHRYGANLTDPQDARRVIASIAAELGKIDILVHVMGGFAGGVQVAETDDLTLNKMMDINLNAAFYVLRALVSLLQTVALENKDKNIRANVILPGTMDTAANRAAMPKASFDNWVKTSHVADVVVMLTGEASTEITGAAIPMYGPEG